MDVGKIALLAARRRRRQLNPTSNMLNESELKAEIGHVLLIDIVGYSKLLINQQGEVLQTLKQLVQETTAVRNNRDGKQLGRFDRLRLFPDLSASFGGAIPRSQRGLARLGFPPSGLTFFLENLRTGAI